MATPLELSRSNRERDRALDADRVMPFSLWCEINAFSLATGRRLRKSGQGPIFTQLSSGRIGVTVRNNRIWQESRTKREGDTA